MAVFTMTAADVAAFVTNVAVSVLIVFANKVLMAPPVAFAFGGSGVPAPAVLAEHHLRSIGGGEPHAAPRMPIARPPARRAATCLCAMHNLAAGGAARLIEGSKTAEKGSTQKSENVPPKGAQQLQTEAACLPRFDRLMAAALRVA